MKIVLELEVQEALMILDPIQNKALTAQRNAARHSGEAREIAELTATICGRVATRLVDGLYPTLNAKGSVSDIRREFLRDEIEFGLT